MEFLDKNKTKIVKIHLNLQKLNLFLEKGK